MKHEDIDVAIRDAQQDDCNAIARLLTELGYASTPDFVSDKIEALAKKTGNGIVVAVIGSEVVGAASLHILPLLHQRNNVCRVTSIVVAEKYRRKGVGKKLMAFAEAYAKANGCSKVEITSGDHRTWAHDFYRQIGYKEASRRFIKVL